MSSIVLITGASGGIGRALARQLHLQGCRVAAAGRGTDRLADVEAAVRIAADTTTPEGAALAIAGCEEALGAPPTLLAHCVGSTLIAPLHRTRADAYREVMRVNLDSAVFMLQAWIGALKGAPGVAVFASSVVARIGVTNHEAIAAAKGGVEALVRSAAATYASQGLRINAVAPGMTETPMTSGMLKMSAMREGAAKQYPLGGVQTADQVADVMAWLLGDGAARLTGQVIAVDGGFTTVRPLVKQSRHRPSDTEEFRMSEDPRCCGSGTCIIDNEGRCWCGQQWDGQKMCHVPLASDPVFAPATALAAAPEPAAPRRG